MGYTSYNKMIPLDSAIILIQWVIDMSSVVSSDDQPACGETRGAREYSCLHTVRQDIFYKSTNY